MFKPELPPPPNDDELDKLAQVSEEALLPEKFDPARPISGNIRCVFCGYNLFTIPRGGLCPECGKPAAGSLHGDAFAYGNPKYVRLLSWGAIMIAWLPAGWFATFLLTLMEVGRNGTRLYLTLAWIVMLGLLFAAGAWLLTIREPNETVGDESRGDFSRWLARIGGIVHGIAQMSWAILPMVTGYRRAGYYGEELFLLVWLTASALSLAMVGPWMKRLSRRTYNKGLPTAMLIACGAPAALLMLLSMWVAADKYLRNTDLMRFINALSCLGTCVWLAMSFLCLPLFVWAWYRFAATLSRAAMLARVHEKYPDARVKL